MRARSIPTLAVALTTALWGLACESLELAPGSLNEIFVAADAELWQEVEDTVRSALSPTVLTVVDEPTFDVVYQDPTEARWARVRKFKQLLVVGTGDDPWVAPALAEVDGEGHAAPALLRAYDVWARNQVVTILLLPEEGARSAVEARLAETAAMYDEMFRQWVLARMFVSGRDSALLDTLASEAGFDLLLPDVYDWDRRDSTYVFRNDNPSPDELIRQVAVTWRSPASPPGQGLTRDAALAWRGEVIGRTVEIPQVVDTTLISVEETRFRQRPALELQATWRNPPSADWPAGGPFLTRLVACEEQDRVYLLDAWLYAPNREKYEYMIQLRTILDSFRCGEDLR